MVAWLAAFLASSWGTIQRRDRGPEIVIGDFPIVPHDRVERPVACEGHRGLDAHIPLAEPMEVYPPAVVECEALQTSPSRCPAGSSG